MPTDQEVIEGFNAGTISQTDYDTFMNGEDLPDDKTAGDSPDPKEEKEVVAEQVKDDPKEEDTEEEEPVILAKDGKHHIPYSELEAARNEAKVTLVQNAELQAKLQQQDAILAEFKKAQEQDVSEGGTAHVDEVFDEFKVEFPGVASTLSEMQQFVSEMKADRDARAAQDKANLQAVEARKDFDAEVTALQPEYLAVSASKEFWEWFDRQPSYIQASKTGTPQVVADVIKTYLDQKPAGLSDTKPGPDKKKVADAIAKAKDNLGINSLSDISGSASASSEGDRIAAMSSGEFNTYLSTKTPDEIDKIMRKYV